MRTVLCAAALVACLTSSLRAQDALVAIEAPMPNSLLGAQWVKPAESGTISGTVIGLDAMSADLSGQIALLSHSTADAEPIRAAVRADGTFELAPADTGLHTLVYQSQDGFAAFALHVIPADAAAQAGTSVVVAASSLSPTRALMTIARYQPPTPLQSDVVGTTAIPAFPLPKVPLNGSRYQVAQNADGGFNGRLISAQSTAGELLPAADVNVLVIQNDELVAQATTEANGTFAVAGLAPGSYSLLASGTEGFAAIGFELVAPDQPIAVSGSDESTRLASAAIQPPPPPSGLELQLAPPNPGILGYFVPIDGPLAEDEVMIPPPPFGPPGFGPGPGFAGGGGFGGGGGGGVGGGSGLLGLAAIGGIIAAVIAADDDEDDVVSPAIP